MAINFPNLPTLNQTFTSGNTIWKWNGAAWSIVPSTDITLNSLTSTTIATTNLTATNLTVTGDFSATVDLSLDDLSNVNAPSPSNLQILQYNSSSQQWVPATISTSFNGGTITNPLVINNNTVSTSSSSGALRISGGVGILDDLYIGGSLVVEDENLEIKTSGEARFYNTSNTNYVGFSAPDTISADRIYVLPQTDGESGQFLRTNGSGVLSWAAVSSPSGGTPPGGIDTQVQFNDSGEFGGSASLTFNTGTNTLTTPILSATGNISTSSTTSSTNSTTGSIVAAGGMGIAGQLNVGGAVNTFTGNTASTSTTTGTVIVTGGLGVSGEINVGANVNSDTAPTDADHLTNKRYVDANILAFSVAFGA